MQLAGSKIGLCRRVPLGWLGRTKGCCQWNLNAYVLELCLNVYVLEDGQIR